MTDLTGRELDAKVAEAMGWTVKHHDDGVGFWCERPSQSKSGWTEVLQDDAYSTDFALLPEMLDWLRENYDFRNAKRVVKLGYGVVCTASVWNGTRGPGPEAGGATLPEAVARLVVAVAAKEAK